MPHAAGTTVCCPRRDLNPRLIRQAFFQRGISHPPTLPCGRTDEPPIESVLPCLDHRGLVVNTYTVSIPGI